MIHSLLQIRGGSSKYSTPYDSTQGVPNYVFMIFWLIIILFALRLAWEFRDKIFKPKEEIKTKKKKVN